MFWELLGVVHFVFVLTVLVCFVVLCDSFNPEFAMSPNNNEVHVYAKNGSKWEVQTVLSDVSNQPSGGQLDYFLTILYGVK